MKLKTSSFEKNRAEPKSLRLLSGCCCSCCSCCIATLAGASVIAASQFKHAAKKNFPEDFKLHRRAARWGATFFLWGFCPPFILAMVTSEILESYFEKSSRAGFDWILVSVVAVFISTLAPLSYCVGKRFGVRWILVTLFLLLFPVLFFCEFLFWLSV